MPKKNTATPFAPTEHVANELLREVYSAVLCRRQQDGVIAAEIGKSGRTIHLTYSLEGGHTQDVRIDQDADDAYHILLTAPLGPAARIKKRRLLKLLADLEPWTPDYALTVDENDQLVLVSRFGDNDLLIYGDEESVEQAWRRISDGVLLLAVSACVFKLQHFQAEAALAS